MIEQFTPFGTAAITVTGSVHQDEVSQVRSYTEECQRLGATLSILVSVTQSPPVEESGTYGLLTGSD
jgi:hypothetical protein